jgi:hypothetical protein
MIGAIGKWFGEDPTMEKRIRPPYERVAAGARARFVLAPST